MHLINLLEGEQRLSVGDLTGIKLNIIFPQLIDIFGYNYPLIHGLMNIFTKMVLN